MKICFFSLILIFLGLKAQAQEEAKFRITHSSPFNATECGAATGVKFERGYLRVAENNKWVDVMLFFQRRDGSFQKFKFEHQGSGVINLNYVDCKYTGNYYAFVCYSNDDNCKFPTEAQVIAKHQQTVATKQPEFKVTRIIPNPQCPDEGVIIETGFVYSPTGGKIDVTLLLEKKDNKGWRKQHFIYQGTGSVKLDINDCNLTGKYKTMVSYASNNN
ncbi:MAG: hypothetical protein EAZ08_13895 [Cytophagales bacterium]|nr:MAG: hypothetical protein EAZ08_13895 [Cytophagales bacterium]